MLKIRDKTSKPFALQASPYKGSKPRVNLGTMGQQKRLPTCKQTDSTRVPGCKFTGGIRQNLFENYYFEKLQAPRARGARARARAARKGRWDESNVNNSGSKLKIRLTGELGNRMARLSRLFLGPGDNF